MAKISTLSDKLFIAPVVWWKSLMSCNIFATCVVYVKASEASADMVPIPAVNSRTFLDVYNCSSRALVTFSEV